MHPILFELHGRPISSWPVFVLTGIWAAYFSLNSDLNKRGISSAQSLIFFISCVLTWFVGAHLGQNWTVGYSLKTPSSGYVLYGGVVSTWVAGWMFWYLLRWSNKIHYAELWDCGSLALAWGLFFGRIGCTLFGCCYGTPAGNWPGYILKKQDWDILDHSFPTGLEGIKLHPTPLYEAFGIAVIIALFYWARGVEKKKPGSFPPGVQGWFCWTLYSLFRFFLEWIRLDPRGDQILGLSPSQWVALLIMATGSILLPYEKKRNRKAIYSTPHPAIR